MENGNCVLGYDYMQEKALKTVKSSFTAEYDLHCWSWLPGHNPLTCKACIYLAKKNCTHVCDHLRNFSDLVVYADMSVKDRHGFSAPRVYDGLWYPDNNSANAARCKKHGCEHYRCLGWIPGKPISAKTEVTREPTILDRHKLSLYMCEGTSAADIQRSAYIQATAFFGVGKDRIRLEPAADSMTIYQISTKPGTYYAHINAYLK